MFTLGILFWLIYGLNIKNYALIVANAITLLLATIILGFKIYNTFNKKRPKKSRRYDVFR
jgi:MtN3 and saliva related transmembrane protein